MIHMDNTNSGFTLLELMVVLIIIGLSASLVSPRVIGIYDKAVLHAEEQKLHDCIALVKNRSFIRQVPLKMVFKDDGVTIEGEAATIKFQMMTFSPLVVTFNGNGFTNTGKIPYLALGTEKVLDVSD
jgi:prepilin-type N-terminal cleavage/methylation domain-containing protein